MALKAAVSDVIFIQLTIIKTYNYIDIYKIQYYLLTILQVEPRVAGGNVELEGRLDHSLKPFRAACSSPFLVAGGHSRASAIGAVSSGQAGELLRF